MKSTVLIVAMIFCGVFGLFAQDHNAIITPKTLENKPLYIVDVDNKRFESPNIQNERDTLVLGKIDPKWIESVNVIRGNEAVDLYGSRGTHGVVMIKLKNGTLASLPEDIRRKFEMR